MPRTTPNARRREELIARRRRLGYTQESLGEAVGVSADTVAMWERGITMPLPRYRPSLADALGTSLAEIERLIDLDAPLVLHDNPLQAVAEWLTLFVRAEQVARAALIFEAVYVPGLLQTRAYAAGVEHQSHRPVTDHDVFRLVDMRMARRAVLQRSPHPLQVAVVLPDYVLRKVVGGRAVMYEQLGHLAELAAWPNVEVRIAPTDTDRQVSAPGSFTLLATAGATRPDLACVDSLRGFTYHEDPDAVQDYASLFDALSDVALDPARSLSLITNIREDYR